MTENNDTPSPGDLKVWWIPQVPMEAFEVKVDSLAEGAKLLDVLAEYDLFQLDHGIRPDFCNAGGVNRWEADDEDGFEWFDVDDSELEEALS